MTKAILFDLDGTFADTAPDLGYAVNLMREARGMAPLPLDATRPVTSLGARGLLGVGFDVTPDHPDYDGLREEFLRLYEQNLCHHTQLFPGMSALVDAIEARGLRWGIVTNKAERFAKPLLGLLQYGHRAACIIGGDTTGKLKPHPEPLLAACRALTVEPATCVYVGDDRRDIEAGRAAGMKTVAVRYGYLNGTSPDEWGADLTIDAPQDLIKIL
ncbi:MAG: phosphoglycolate phosphatase [Burkholderiales bacterium]|nr:phosphoglycolate phosphatase [Burkholderiales bacterium]